MSNFINDVTQHRQLKMDKFNTVLFRHKKLIIMFINKQIWVRRELRSKVSGQGRVKTLGGTRSNFPGALMLFCGSDFTMTLVDLLFFRGCDLPDPPITGIRE